MGKSSARKKRGIYCIKNTQNGKVYIGQSVSIDQRLNQHRTDLRCGRHKNCHLMAAVKKYGFDNFEFTVLEIVNSKEEPLTRFEQKWVDHFRSNEKEHGYNIRDTVDSNLGNAPWNKGHTLSQDTKNKITVAVREYWSNPENRKKQGQRLTGRIMGDEWRKKISNALRERWDRMQPEEKELALNPMRDGWKKKEPWKQISWQMANAVVNVGRPAHNKGSFHNEETKRKMRESWAARRSQIGELSQECIT